MSDPLKAIAISTAMILGTEGEGRFLNLGQRLKQRDDNADRHGGADSGAGADQNRPDGGMEKIERVGFIHRKLTRW
jgi:hypothetical protein